jgi:endonuclease-3
VPQAVDRDEPAATRAPVILDRLDREYHGGVVELDWSTPFELLIATILSAQSTDKKVNQLTPGLFAKYPGPAEYLAVPEEELQADIYQTGFYRQKTKSIRGLCQALLTEHDGEVPLSMAELTRLPGVARKTANVVLGAAAPAAHYEDPDAGIAVDTHVKRLSRRLGFTEHTEPTKIERDLMQLFARQRWPRASLAIILHGRRVCEARAPWCAECVVEELCPSSQLAGRPDRAGHLTG